MNTKIKLFQVGIAMLVSSIVGTTYAADKIVYPIQEMSKLECRFQDFDTLSSKCKMQLPDLKTKDYKKYATKDGGYNDYTRIYTVLWGASYKYGWDQGNGGHQGVDIATAKGTPVYAMADGKVIVAKTDIGWGKVVSIQHTIDGKKVVSDYAHLSVIGVKKGDTVKAGDKIGEVGSTGNSTGNHLHFQIDFDAPFYPYYYDYKACPYSYYEITEKGVCFDELSDHTIDPLLFLETNGAVLDRVVIQTSSDTKTTTTKTTTTVSTSKGSLDTSIFYTYVYKESSKGDIREVQNIFRLIGEYNGDLTGDYDDIEDIIIDYQVRTGVIPTKNSDGAGYWGPKTRAQTKLDYDVYLVNGGKENGVVVTQDTPKATTSDRTLKSGLVTEKISKEGLLSREDREKKELDDFLKVYDIKLKNTGNLDSVAIGKNTTILLQIQTKKGKAFKGTTPGNITFMLDESVATVFPTKFFYFDNGEREVYVQGVKEGTTTLSIKLGDRIIKTTKVTVENGTTSQARQDLGIQTGKLYATSSTVIGESKTGIVLLKDAYGKKMINQKYTGEFAVNATTDAQYCIKKGKLEDIKTIFKRKCKESEYQDTLVYDYSDTVAGLLIFDYKLYDRNSRLELVKIDGTQKLSAKNITVKTPKGLESTYAYHDEVVETLEKGITTGINKGYFLEDRRLTEYDATVWIKNTLTVMKEETGDLDTKGELSKKILTISKDLGNTRKYITREDFLDMATQYLVLDESMIGSISIDFKDLDDTEDIKANIFFTEGNSWKDKFGENYFRPNEQITRGEGAYLMARAIETNKNVFLASR